MRHIILGTAGHIDHGKSSLVKALTGIDPDRLKEEKERGITIDIGFADLVFPEHSLSVGIVDVPGHERLVRNMLAGTGGIDMVLLVVAADEGIMPQSREHLAICNLLKIRTGLVAVTKSDLVDQEWLGLVAEEVREAVMGTFLEGAPVIPVSSRTGSNLDLLKQTILELGLRLEPKSSAGLFRLPIDRVFTLKGFGTVITGTAVSGSISVDDPVEIIPAGIETKVRGLHSHGQAMEAVTAGQRVAINLQGVNKEELRRGDVAVTPGSFGVTRTVDAVVDMLEGAPPLKNRGLVHFYSGTAEAVARVIIYEKGEVKAGERAYCQFRLSSPVVAVSGDRYIIRRFSPLETMGGGEILDPSPVRRGRSHIVEDLRVLHSGGLEQKISLKISSAGKAGMPLRLITGWISADVDVVKKAVEELRRRGDVVQYEDILLHKSALDGLQEKLREVLRRYHAENPLRPGMVKEEVRGQLGLDQRMFSNLLNSSSFVVAEQKLLRMKDFSVALSSSEEGITERIVSTLDLAGFQPPTVEEVALSLKMERKRMADILGILSKEGKVVRVSDSYFISHSVYMQMIGRMKEFFSRKGEMTVAEFRDILQTSRKYALPFLEFLDSRKITLRTGDVRKFLLKG